VISKARCGCGGDVRGFYFTLSLAHAHNGKQSEVSDRWIVLSERDAS